VKLYLAAIDSPEAGRVARQVRPPYMLCSFFHSAYTYPLKSTRVQGLYSALAVAEEVLIDSGAFSLRTATARIVAETQGASGAKDVDYDAYLHQYAEWLKTLARVGLAHWWVEIDIALVVGEAWVAAQRKKLVAAGLGAKLINVWHSENDWDHWLYLLREASAPGRSRYVAIEGHQLGRNQLDYARFLHEAYRRGVRVHGFRMTNSEDLRKWPFYSVDSSSWQYPVLGGGKPAFLRTGGCVNSMLAQKNQNTLGGMRPGWRGVLPHKGTTTRQRLDLMAASMRMWVKAGEEYDTMWRRRGVDWERALAAPEVTEWAR
jgi:hypothetical protein